MADTFPTLTAKNLAGTELQLPSGFSGQKNLVLIAFERDQQKDVDTWLKVLPALAQAHPTLAYYELPTIKRMNGMVRFFIDNGMRGGIPDKQQRARTITLYIDKEPFKKALNIPSEDRIYALLLDKSGKVLWRADGLYDEAKGQALTAALAQ
jgi:hypothetical protein